ncbi:RHS repeat-associated core domain-containing protein [Pseudomonas sp. MHK4]
MNTLKNCSYRYDALDSLVAIEPVGGEKRQRFYAREQLVTELQGQSSQSVLQHGKQLLALQSRQGHDVQSGLLATDQQRSVLGVIEPGGAVRQAYAPYGHRWVESGPGSLLGFAGEAVDPGTGHYLLGNGHRAFNPVLMRFNSPDRLSPFGRGGLNPYGYCLGDPVNFSDPTGRFADIAKLLTSVFSVGSARIVMSPAIPYKLAKDALQWGAASQLPFKHTFGAASAVVGGATTLVSALTGVASAVASVTGDSESARILGFVALGLGALTVTARVGSLWATRDPKTIPSLKGFVERHKPVKTTGETPPASPALLNAAQADSTGGPRTSFAFPRTTQNNSGTRRVAKIRRNSV